MRTMARTDQPRPGGTDVAEPAHAQAPAACASTVTVTLDGADTPATWTCTRLAGHGGTHHDRDGRAWGRAPLCRDVWITGPGHDPVECMGDLGHNGPHHNGDLRWQYTATHRTPEGTACSTPDAPAAEPGSAGSTPHGADAAYRRRPLTVTARQVTGDDTGDAGRELATWCRGHVGGTYESPRILLAETWAEAGDWIIALPDGTFEALTGTQFARYYTRVPDRTHLVPPHGRPIIERGGAT